MAGLRRVGPGTLDFNTPGEVTGQVEPVGKLKRPPAVCIVRVRNYVESAPKTRVSLWRMRSTALLLVALCLAAPLSALDQQDSSSRTLRYSIYSAGQKCGVEVDTFSANGKLTSTFEFNDRGRGPKIEAHYVLAKTGMPLRTDITGVDYYKAPVDEHFSAERGQG